MVRAVTVTPGTYQHWKYVGPMSAKRVIIYIRLSSFQGEGDTTTSPERQEEACRAYAAAKGWDVIDVIYDLDVSGSDKGLRLDRPGLVKVREAWASADVLLFAKIDRLARNVLDWSRLREEADAVGVALVSVADNLDLTTPSGRFVATILQAFAEMEAAMISTRTREAVAYLAQAGRYRGGKTPFGWQKVQVSPTEKRAGYRLALNPDEAPILREAVTRTINGESSTTICDDFNRRGHPGPQGAGWQANTLRRLLQRSILRGMLTHQGDLVRDELGFPIRPHEALVTDDEWMRLQAATAWTTPERRPGNVTTTSLLLRGLATCRECGDRLHSSAAKGQFPQWACSRRFNAESGGRCSGTVISRPRLEAYVLEEVLSRVGSLPGTVVVLEERADAEVARVEEALSAVLDRLRDTDDPDTEEALLVQRRALRARLKALHDAPVIREASERPTGRTFAQDWDAADDRGKATLLASVLAICAVSRGKRGTHPLDESRVTLVFQPTPTAAAGTVPAGVVYRAA